MPDGSTGCWSFCVCLSASFSNDQIAFNHQLSSFFRLSRACPEPVERDVAGIKAPRLDTSSGFLFFCDFSLGSPRDSRAGDAGLAVANFDCWLQDRRLNQGSVLFEAMKKLSSEKRNRARARRALTKILSKDEGESGPHPGDACRSSRALSGIRGLTSSAHQGSTLNHLSRRRRINFLPPTNHHSPITNH
jgi:hypothetical protein